MKSSLLCWSPWEGRLQNHWICCCPYSCHSWSWRCWWWQGWWQGGWTVVKTGFGEGYYQNYLDGHDYDDHDLDYDGHVNDYDDHNHDNDDYGGFGDDNDDDKEAG